MTGTFGAMYSAVSALTAQGQALGAISDAIANLKTTGFKVTDTQFKTIVTASAMKGGYSPGGVRALSTQLVDEQGLLEPTSSPTDIALAGQGFFVVNRTLGGKEFAYTRAGSFQKDKDGYLYNAGGYFLFGWETDVKGNVASPNDGVLDDLKPVRLNGVTGISRPTTKVILKGNLDANWNAASPTPPLKATQRIYDSLGTGHDVIFTFTRAAANAPAELIWDVTISVSDGTITRLANSPTNANAAFATTAMRIVYNNDGTPRSYDGRANGAAAPILHFDWGANSAAAAMDINLDLGTPGVVGTGKSDGFTCLGGASVNTFKEQDGLRFGLFEGVEIGEDGIVTARFDNGQSVAMYRLPIANFANPNALLARTGNVWQQTQESGEYVLGKAKTPGRGIVNASTLEGSKADLGKAFTQMIVTQKAFSANTKIISIANQMSDELQKTL